MWRKTASISSSAGPARITRVYGCARTARGSTAGASTPTSSLSCGRWPVRCRTWGLRLLSIGPGRRQPREHSWTRTRVASLRKDHGIPVYREGERAERGEVTLDEAAEALAVGQATLRRLIVEGALPANQPCKGAPWTIRASDLRRTEVAEEAKRRRKRSRIGPPSEDEPTLPLNFQ